MMTVDELHDKIADTPQESVADASSISDDLKEVQDLKAEQNLIYHADQADNFPEGGTKAWLVVFGTACSAFSTFGYVNAWGVFQAYYQETVLKDHSPADIAWIGSVQYSLVYLPGLVTGRMFDLGHFKIPLFVSSCLLVLATCLVAECKSYWQFLLCQGFATGLACGMIFGPCMGVLSHWFKERRGIAMAMLTVGSSIGGTVFPIAAKRLIIEVGFQWTMRIISFILVVTLGIANLTLERRLPPRKATGGLLNLGAFKNLGYTIWCLSCFVAFLGLYTVLTYIDISAVYVGIDPDFAFYLISLANATSGFGRIFAGFMADRFGAINVLAPCTLVAGVLTFAWPYATSKGAFVAVAIIYGFSSGTYISLIGLATMAFGKMEDVGRRMGMTMTIFALGALAGVPISGAINRATDGYTAVGYYAGSMIVFAVVLAIISRQIHLGWKLKGKF